MIYPRPHYEATFGPPPITESAAILRGAIRARCDSAGRWYADLPRLRSLLPHTERRRWSAQRLTGAIAALQTAGLVDLYTVAGETYLELTDFRANDPRPDGSPPLIQTVVFPQPPRRPVEPPDRTKLKQIRRERDWFTPHTHQLCFETRRPARGIHRLWYVYRGPRLDRLTYFPPYMTAGTTLLAERNDDARLYHLNAGAWQKIGQAATVRELWPSLRPLFGGIWT